MANEIRKIAKNTFGSTPTWSTVNSFSVSQRRGLLICLKCLTDQSTGAHSNTLFYPENGNGKFLTSSVGETPSCETDSRSASQENSQPFTEA
jgi:hypothetical protein